MQQILDRQSPETDTLVEPVEELLMEQQSIANEHKKFLKQFVVLCSLTHEYFDFTRTGLLRLQELKWEIMIAQATNRKERNRLQKLSKEDLKKFKQTLTGTGKTLRYFTEYWEDDPDYSQWVDQTKDNIGEVLDSQELFINK